MPDPELEERPRVYPHILRIYLELTVVPEQSSISGQPSDGNTDVIINMEDLLLMSSELRLSPLKHTHVTILYTLKC